MRLSAKLTSGWLDDPDAPLAAARLHREVSLGPGDYAERLAAVLQGAGPGTDILGLDRLFRRRAGGFLPIRQFVGALASLPEPDSGGEALVCQIDAFAYGFLKGAKNLDLMLPCSAERNVEFQATRRGWARTRAALTEFERVGEPLPADIGVTPERYLALREILVRPSARDERRSLITLLVGGPSTRVEISEDLGLNHTLGERVLAPFVAIDVIERRTGHRYCIEPRSLALVAFALRETTGLDLIEESPMGG